MTGLSDAIHTNSLARGLKVGLLGSPYDWGTLNLEQFQQQHVDLVFTSFAGTRESDCQDLLIQLTPGDSSSPSFSLHQTESGVLSGEFPDSFRYAISPEWIWDVFSNVTERMNECILNNLHEHEEKYMSTERIIARYGTEVLRVCSVLGRPHVHIENEALAYLIESPWRNAYELEFLIAWMVYSLDGDVMRKSYVQKTVYEFGTSARGVSNSNAVRSLIGRFTQKVLSEENFQTAIRLFKIQLAPMVFAIPTTESIIPRRRAA